ERISSRHAGRVDLIAMSRPAAERAEVAALAAKVAALPSHLDEPPPGVRRWLYRLTYGLGWLVTVSLLVVGLFRIFNHDGTHFFTWLNAFTRYVYLPAYFCLA